MNGSTSLSEEFLRALVDELAGKQTVAIILAGSHAQGVATPYSDVDMAHLVAAPLSGPDKRYHYREGHLVSVATRPLAWFRAAVTRPGGALVRGDRLSLFEAASSLWYALTQAVAVQRGVL